MNSFVAPPRRLQRGLFNIDPYKFAPTDDAYWNYVVALWKAEDGNGATTVADSSPYLGGNNILLQGATVSTANPKFGTGSMTFNGTTQYGTVYTEPFGISQNGEDFCMEAWVYCTSVTGNRTLVTDYAGATRRGFHWYVADGSVAFRYSAAGTSDTASTATTGTFSINTWTHVAVVRNGTSIQCAINGVFSGTPINIGATNIWCSDVATQKVGIVESVWFHSGEIDELRITRGHARYTANFTPPSGTFPVTGPALVPATSCLLHFNGTNGSTTFTDSSANALTVTAGGNAQLTTTGMKYGSACLALDGTGDYASITAATPLQLEGPSWCIEGWFKLNTVTGIHTVVSQSTADAAVGIHIYMDAALLKFNVGNTNTVAWQVTLVSGTLTTGTWYHFAFAKSNFVYRAFVDGTQVGASTTYRGPVAASKTKMVLGIQSSTLTQYPFNGYIDDFRVTNNGPVYTANFTPPSEHTS